MLFSMFLPPLCSVCEAALPTRENWVCRKCGTDLAARAGRMERLLDIGREGPIQVVHSLSYSPAVSRLIKEMKYSDRPGLAEFFGPFLGFILVSMDFVRPVLVPVPLHAAKRRERGYNQSELLSLAVGRLTGIEVETRALFRSRNTSSQAGLDGDSRLINVRRAFSSAAGLLEGRHVILIDDVVTTGATLKECARVLYESGVPEVTGCVIASSA